MLRRFPLTRGGTLVTTSLLCFAAAAVLVGGSACAVASPQQAQARPLVDAGAPFGRLPLVDEVDCGATPPGAGDRPFVELPQGASRVETILGRRARVLPNEGDTKYFAYRIGRGKGLKPGAAYVLTVEYPEDRARTLFISNRGAEMTRGVATGAALGDVLYTYTNNNSESLRYPLSGRYRTWKNLFHLHDRFPDISQPRGAGARPMLPADGFWVIISQAQAASDPLSAGAAVARIRLFEVPDEATHYVKLNPPPAGLPRRHVFWREEMADGVVSSAKEEERGVAREIDWFDYRARRMRLLGVNTFTTDLLEFGHNQGWDSGPTNDWYNASRTPRRWEQILAMVRPHGLDVLPYYEYAGSVGQKGLGSEKRSRPLSGKEAYTHITWSEKANADVTDPDTLADAKRLLDATVTRYKDRADFAGAWFRPRPSHIPISFADAALGRFAKEANGGKAATLEQLRADDALRGRYYDWWFGKRRDFLAALTEHLRRNVHPDAVLLFTADTSEPGRPLPGPMGVVTDDPAAWKAALAKPQPGNRHPAVVDAASLAGGGRYLETVLSPVSTWGEWEWQHSAPQADPARYKTLPATLLTIPINRAYTVASPEPFDAFRSGAGGLAVVRHFPLNENTMDKSLGYFVADVDRSGPHSLMAEARAVANGDPYYLGYLTASAFNPGFPEYVRPFYAAFVALPALPSRVVPNAAGADPEVVVRAIATPKNGTYFAVVNTGLAEKANVSVRLPAGTRGKVTDAATGKEVAASSGTVRLTLAPCSLTSLHVP